MKLKIEEIPACRFKGDRQAQGGAIFTYTTMTNAGRGNPDWVGDASLREVRG